MYVNPFDVNIIHFLNQFAQQSHFRDYFIDTVSTNRLLTTAFLSSILWWAWFRNDITGQSSEQAGVLCEDRKIITTGVILCILAIFMARALAVLLPFRERPLRNPALHFHLPFGLNTNNLFGWSSFPSDHATFFFALGMTIFCISRKLGIAVWCYSFFVACVPLVYQGIHYPTGILAGALIGTAIGSLNLNKRVRASLSSAPLRWVAQSPRTFYPCLFLITFLFGVLFNPVRLIATASQHAIRDILHHHF
ncbi:phosphatase PAP2 family protein [Edaphobacter acidisoli]|nr:phosphatase PAP2 family protein [Edaphobacter acidisoli]